MLHSGPFLPMITLPPASCDNQHRTDVDEPSAHSRTFERHVTPKELARLWHKDECTIRRLFRNEPGVMCFESMNRRRGTRPYISLSIPESVAVRVHQRLENRENAIRQPQTRKRPASSMTEAVQSTFVTSASECGEAVSPVDEQWEHEVLRTAQRLRNRVGNRKP